MSGPDDAVLLARAAWSRLVEPGDEVAGLLVGALGPQEALSWLRSTAHPPAPSAVLPGLGAVPCGASDDPSERAGARRLAAAADRWRVRLDTVDPRRDLRALGCLGGRLLVPEAPGWPAGLDELGPAAPMCLWVRGTADVAAALAGSVAVVGARACSAYGEYVTAELAVGLAEAGRCVVSGGAYGIDAVAHRAAVVAGGTTVAFLAGGVDRLYPAGNADLLRAITESGALVSEVPPGSAPAKSRFLQRNRLIAAATRATVVVEAAWRSGALSTARHAARLLRPVGAVPGPVTAVTSAGCHRLMRDGCAVCVTGAAEVLELVEPVPAPEPRVPVRPEDDLDEVQRRALDALPVRRAAPEEALARTAGLTPAELRGALGRLELAGLARRDGGGWRR